MTIVEIPFITATKLPDFKNVTTKYINVSHYLKVVNFTSIILTKYTLYQSVITVHKIPIPTNLFSITSILETISRKNRKLTRKRDVTQWNYVINITKFLPFNVNVAKPHRIFNCFNTLFISLLKSRLASISRTLFLFVRTNFDIYN